MYEFRGGTMYEQLSAIIGRKFQLSPDQITPASTLNDLGLDSLDVVELALVIDEELGVHLTDDELVAAGHVGAVAELAASRSAA